MDVLLLLLLVAAVSVVAKFFLLPEYRRIKEREREDAEQAELFRTASLYFRDDITDEQFAWLVQQFANSYKVKKLKSLEANGHMVLGTVTANSRITTWEFEIDYDSYGHLSSKYSIYSENDDSPIPEIVAEGIASSIRNWGSLSGAGWTRNDFHNESMSQLTVIHPPFCPYCGMKLSPSFTHCPSCGKKVPLVEP